MSMKSEDKPLISWIVPAYNVEAFIVQCLQTLVSAGLHVGDYEIIVVNDGSTDNTLKIVNDYASSIPEIKVVTQENQGLSATRNNAIELAQGEYIHFVDSDDYVINEKQLVQCIRYASNNNLDVLVFESQIVSLDSYPGKCGHNNNNVTVFSETMDGPTLWEKFSFVNTAWTYVIKRQFVIENHLRFVPGLLMEDFQFNINTFFVAKRCVKTNNIIYCYRHNPNSIMHNTLIEKQMPLLTSYIANAKYASSFLENNGNQLNEGAWQVVKDRGNRMLIYGLMRAFKVDKTNFFFKELKKNNLHPFEWMKRPEYQMKKLKLFYNISQHECLTIFLSKLYKLYGKINPKALQFDNW